MKKNHTRLLPFSPLGLETHQCMICFIASLGVVNYFGIVIGGASNSPSPHLKANPNQAAAAAAAARATNHHHHLVTFTFLCSSLYLSLSLSPLQRKREESRRCCNIFRELSSRRGRERETEKLLSHFSHSLAPFFLLLPPLFNFFYSHYF